MRKEHPMADPLPVSMPLRTATLGGRKPTRFDFRPDAAQRDALALVLGISAIPALRFKGEVRPLGRSDLVLEALLDATVVQPCVISLAPVTTQIHETVLRKYLRDYALPEEDEAEMSEDDTSEPLPDSIDPGAVMTEALALALPDYPRAPGAVHGEVAVAPPGAMPLRDADLKPFAGLADLAKRLSGGSGEGGGDSGA
jgi:uncharacterized metal-binding protein YceD (DUF177 family)